jgi:alpha-tubulin suppressor-like RCC1 family protein/Tfp pilus assembly protein PilX
MMNVSMKHMLRHDSGFALPTILIASVIMLMVLMASITAVSSITSGLNSQYYNQLAREAAESGLARAESCLRLSDYTPTWTDADPLTPAVSCTGANLGGVDEYIVDTASTRSSFTVARPTVGAASSVNIVAVGKVELLRGSDGSVWRSYTVTVGKNSRYNDTPQIAGGAGWKTVGVGGYSGHNGYMLAGSGILYGWGDNSGNQLGDSSLGTTITIPIKITMPTDVTRAKKVANSGQGASILCILATSGSTGDQVYCRGSGGLGGATWQRFGLTAGLTAIDVVVNGFGTDSACVLASDAHAYCAGMNDSGNLGNAITTQAFVALNAPTKFRLDLANPGPTSGSAGSLTVKKVFNQDRYTCVIASDDQAYCAGDNQNGQLGQGTLTADIWIGKSIPGRAIIPGNPVVRDIRFSYHAGASQVFFGTTANLGDIYMAGSNHHGTAIDGCFGSTGGACSGYNVYSTPRLIAGGDWSKLVSIGEQGLDRSSICAIVTSPVAGTSGMVCAGRNAYGQLGIGSCTEQANWGATVNFTGESIAPTLMGAESNYQMNSMMAITSAGNVWASGDNTYGKLGTNGTLQACNPTPAKVQLPAGVKGVALANGDEYTAFILGDNGKVYSMGRNNNGQLGNGTMTDSKVPVEVKIPRQETLF